MALRHRIDAALLKYAEAMLAEAREESTPLASMAAHADDSARELAEAAHNMQRMVARAGLPQEPVAPLTQLPQADPAIMSDVLQRARVVRDPTDYLRLLSHDKDVNELARTAALPALLLTDALTSRGVEGAQTRETIIDVLRNLQLPATSPARAPAGPAFQGAVPMNSRAYPAWYPR
jgi:hypothetical protein